MRIGIRDAASFVAVLAPAFPSTWDSCTVAYWTCFVAKAEVLKGNRDSLLPLLVSRLRRGRGRGRGRGRLGRRRRGRGRRGGRRLRRRVGRRHAELVERGVLDRALHRVVRALE